MDQKRGSCGFTTFWSSWRVLRNLISFPTSYVPLYLIKFAKTWKSVISGERAAHSVGYWRPIQRPWKLLSQESHEFFHKLDVDAVLPIPYIIYKSVNLYNKLVEKAPTDLPSCDQFWHWTFCCIDKDNIGRSLHMCFIFGMKISTK